MKLRTYAILVAMVLFVSVSSVAQASSTIVNTQLDRFGSAIMGLMSLQVQVTYRADVRNADTGVVIPNGGSVPAGTNVLFTCGEHTYDDVYWFATGYNADSPYGDWTNDAARPAGDLCIEKNYVPFDGRTEGHRGRTYATFAVNPPTSVVSGLPANCVAAGTGTGKVCRNVQMGTLTATCSYPATYGKFYGLNGLLGPNYVGSSASCDNQANPMVSNNVSVPAASMTHTVTVVDANPNDTPAAPSVAAAGAGSCFVGTPYAISMRATDPNNQPIRYSIDWDNNGTIDQLVPPNGYVPSGTTQQASRTYTTAGTKTVRVFAQNEDGLVSVGTTFSFTCAARVNQNPDDYEDIIIPNTNDVGDPGDAALGAMDLSIRAIPSLVSFGQTTQIHWSAAHVVSCQVLAPNGDTWLGLQSPIGGEESSGITTETIYTLRCLDAQDDEHTATARVNVLPRWEEF